MRGFGFKENGFFVCTETTPRCYVIQEVSDVNRALDDLNKGPGRSAEPNSNNNNNNASDQNSPYLPFLPYWFTAECRQQLLNVAAPSPTVRAPTPSPSTNGYEPSPTPEPPGGMNPEQLRIRLKSQLEFYFSRENLMNDRYLRSQMDADQYVAIKIVSNFPKITRLTTDYDLIVSVLRESNQVQVDEAGEKVRPVTKRCTIILREIPEDANEADVKAMFDGIPYQSLSYAGTSCWYVSFSTEEQTQTAFLRLQNAGLTFNNKPVYARIKTGGAPIVTDSYQYGTQDKIITNAGTAYKTNVGISPGGETVITGQITVHEVIAPPGETNLSNPPPPITTSSSSTLNGNIGFSLGQVLASYGYVPRASFRPSVTSIAAMSATQQTTNTNTSSTSTALAFTTPTVPITMPMSLVTQQPRFLQNRSNVPFAKCSSTDANATNETEKNKENSQNRESASAKKPLTSNDTTSKFNSQNSQTGRSSNKAPYSSSSNNFNTNKSTSNANRSGASQSQSNYNVATPLNKVNAHDPNKVATTNSYNKDNSYQRNTRENRGSNNNNNQTNERRDRPTNSQSGRNDQRSNTTGRSSNTRNEYYASNKSTQQRNDSNRSSNRHYNNSGGYSNRDYSYQQHSNSQRHNQHDSSNSDAERNESTVKEKSFDFVETDFPCLVEKEFKRQNSKQTAVPKEERAQFSAVVAGRRPPKVVEEKRSTYAQTLKRSANLSGRSSEHND